jgi:hypothetical protein
LFLGVGDRAFADDYVGISFTGKGTSPSAMSRFTEAARSQQMPRSSVSASDRGDAAYVFEFELRLR